MKRIILIFSAVILLIIFDQWTKFAISSSFRLGETQIIIDGLFNLTHVRNAGAAFGFGNAFNGVLRLLVLFVVPVIACIWLSVMIIKNTSGQKLLTSAYALILAGAIGNLIDRFRYNYVVDFLDFYQGKYHFATFNVADTVISTAAGILIIDYFVNKKIQPKS